MTRWIGWGFFIAVTAAGCAGIGIHTSLWDAVSTDFADADRDGIPGELVDRQPDLRISIDDKLDRLDAVLDEVAKRWEFATLADVAADVQRSE